MQFAYGYHPSNIWPDWFDLEPEEGSHPVRKKARKEKPDRGEKHGRAKLKEHEVVEIKRLLAEGVGQRELSRQYGVAQATIHLIAIGRNWAWVKLPSSTEPVHTSYTDTNQPSDCNQ